MAFQKRTEYPNNEENVTVVMDVYESAKVLNVSETDSSKEWIIDSRYSFHMCPTKSWFETFTVLDGGHIIIGNNKSYKVLGIGTIKLKIFNEVEKLLREVRYILELKRNLISLEMLDKVGYSIKTHLGMLKITKVSHNVIEINNCMYTLIGKIVIGEAFLAKKQLDKVTLWHLRLGHMSQNSIIK